MAALAAALSSQATTTLVARLAPRPATPVPVNRRPTPVLSSPLPSPAGADSSRWDRMQNIARPFSLIYLAAIPEGARDSTRIRRLRRSDRSRINRSFSPCVPYDYVRLRLTRMSTGRLERFLRFLPGWEIRGARSQLLSSRSISSSR
jgi:hypothetical protein